MSTIDWPRFVEIIRSNSRFLLTSHIRPDCDALGSELGMAGVLEALGKNVTILNGHATPPNLEFIDPDRRIQVLGREVTPENPPPHDVLIVLDTSAWQQLGGMADVVKASKALKMVLDHHVGEDDMGAELFKNTTAEATGRLVVEAAGHLNTPLSREMAIPLFAAIATDTGWFRFGSTSPTTYRVAAQLLEAGARPDQIYGALYEQDSLARVKLRGTVLTKLVSELDGRLMHTNVRLADFAATGALPSDTEDVINLALGVRGAEVAVILVEQATGGYKISFRSRCAVDCNQLARQFAGGGHKAAAGAFLAGEFNQVQTRVLDAVRLAMR